MTTLKDTIKTAAPVIFLVLAACQNQTPSQSQAVSDCLTTAGCPAIVAQYSNGSSNGQLTALGQTYTVPSVPAALPATATTTTGATVAAANPSSNSTAKTSSVPSAKDISDATSGDNAFAKVAGANAAMAADNWQVGSAVKQQAASETPNSAARVMSASELGQDPADGAASSR